MTSSRAALLRVGGLFLLCLLLGCATGPLQLQRPSAPLEPLADAPVDAGGAGGPAGSIWQPLTVARLVALAQGLGLGVQGPRVVRNRQIGLAFQRVIATCLDIPSNFRAFPTAERTQHRSVIPDGLVMATKLTRAGRIGIDPEGAFLEIVGDDFLDLLEIKVRSTRITPSTAQGQIRGLIDVLSRLGRPRGGLLSALNPTPRRALLLVTPADTEVSQDVAWMAARRGVAVYQSAAQESGGAIGVGPFIQKTSFADVLPQFLLPCEPAPLSP